MRVATVALLVACAVRPGQKPDAVDSAAPTSDPTVAEDCANGADDDGDGDIDCVDDDCTCREDCGNGVDDDRDGLTDCADEECACTEVCDDGVDDDGDGLVDCADPDCTCVEDCANGADDDRDGAIDCADLDCSCPEDCTNGLDDDRDGAIDCADLDCVCPEDCRNGVDDDADGDTDCDDLDCVYDCGEDDCFDGVDDDADGFTDCDDLGCLAVCDLDGDLFVGAEFGGPDCDDADPAVNPGAADACGDRFDQDCDGWDCAELATDVGVLWTASLAEEYAGAGVAVGDLDGDGHASLIVTSSAAGNPDNGGRIYIIDGIPPSSTLEDAASVWAESDDVRGHPEHRPTSGFDGDGDGSEDLLVADLNATPEQRETGAIHLLHGPLIAGSVEGQVHATVVGRFQDLNFGTGLAVLQGDDGTVQGYAAAGVGYPHRGLAGELVVLADLPAGVHAVSDLAHTRFHHDGRVDAGELELGLDVKLLGDISGDGLADLVVPAEPIYSTTLDVLLAPFPDGDLAIDDVTAGTWTLGTGMLCYEDALLAQRDLTGDGHLDALVSDRWGALHLPSTGTPT